MEGWDTKRIRQESEKRKAEMQSQAEEKKKGGGGDDPPAHFVRECLDANYLGDGMLYAYLHKGKFLFSFRTGEWLIWAGHHWQLDITEEAKKAVEDLVPYYLAERERIEEQIREAQKEEKPIKGLIKRKDKVNGRIDRLRSIAGRNAALEFAYNCQDGLGIDGAELDQSPWLLPVANGVIDLKTGLFRDGRPEDLMTKACPVEWQGFEAERAVFEEFLWAIMEDQEKINFMQRWFGYCLTGDISEQKFLCLTGDGRNGKGVLAELLNEIMGGFCGPIKSELLLDQGRVQNSSAPSGDILDMQGMRMLIASESDEGRRFSPSKIKQYTGQDTLIGRYAHDKRQTAFMPTHKMAIQTNNKPHAPADDIAFWDRLLEVHFPFLFKDDPVEPHHRKRDNQMGRKLREVIPGVLAWMVEGALLWQKHGLFPPLSILESVGEYQREEDQVQDWVDHCCYIPEELDTVKTSAAQLYENFMEWWKTNQGTKVPSGTWFGRRLSKKFKKCKEAGANHYVGIGLAAM